MKDISLEELSFAVDQVFVYWEDLAAIIIDFPKIVKEWSNKSYLELDKSLSIKPLDKELAERFAQKNQTISDCKSILKSLIDRFYTQTTFTRVSNYIIIKDLEKGFTADKIPSGGIVLDSSHCIATLYNEILLSHDQHLNASVDYWFKQLKKDARLFRETAKNLN
ncbi:hypothetical protein [Flavobacterium adhaerens]|uniref:hypothetical protein n=1 Tax=Flavobacterium adhaerens TaxID=3149043 RepID=UPI0032B59C99